VYYTLYAVRSAITPTAELHVPISKCHCWSVVADGVVIAGEPHFRRCCDLAEHIPNLFSPHFAVVNLDPANLHGLFVDTKVVRRVHGL